MKTPLITALALTGAVALAACGSTAGTATGTARAPVAPAAQSAGPATQAAVPAPTQVSAGGPARLVAIKATNDLYSIQKLEVKVGERIQFDLENIGDEKHNIVAVGEGLSIVSPDFDAGQKLSWTWTAPQRPMEFKFVCAFHKEVPPILVTVK